MHWFVAAAVIVLLALGPVMKRLVPEGSLRDNLYNFHEALGALVLIVMVVRLVRRLAFGVPAPDASMPLVEQRASLWAQYALYVLLFVTTVLGWAGTNAYGDPVSVFGLFDFPTILGKDQPLSDRIIVWHLICGILIGVIVALHIAGALYHRLVKHDRVLERMLARKLMIRIGRRASRVGSAMLSSAASSRARGVRMLEKFERYPLTFGPTPIERLKRLSAHLGDKVELYAKREDCNSGLAYGGNKLRKLEYIIPDAIASNADTLVSIGGVQSNHTRQVAAVAAKIGMKCRLVQEAWVPHEDAVYDRVGNIMLSRIMGADVRLVDDGFDIGIRKSWEDALEDVEAQGGRPYAIPAGASVHKYRRARLCRLRRGGARAGARARLCVRLYRRVHGDRLDPCRHGRRLRQGRPAAQGDRHRRLRDAEADQSAGARHRAQDRETDRARAGHRRRRRGADRGLRLSHLWRAVRGDQGRRSGSWRGSKA